MCTILLISPQLQLFWRDIKRRDQRNICFYIFILYDRGAYDNLFSFIN